jgi:hypothetical protein
MMRWRHVAVESVGELAGKRRQRPLRPNKKRNPRDNKIAEWSVASQIEMGAVIPPMEVPMLFSSDAVASR